MLSLEDFKRFAGECGDDNDLLMVMCLNAAKAYVAAAGVNAEGEKDEMYPVCVYSLASYYLDNRSAIGDASPKGLPPVVVSLLTSLSKTPRKGSAKDGA